MRQGSHPSACAASSTVALETSNSMMRSSIPSVRKYARTLSIAMGLISLHQLKFRYFSFGAGAGSARTSVSISMLSPPETTRLQEAVRRM